MDSIKAGVWKRYKAENEEEQFKIFGFSALYEKMKDVEVTVTVEVIDGAYVETFKRGEYKASTTIVGDSVKVDLGSGKMVELSKKDIKDGAIEFTMDGVKRRHRREVKEDDEFIGHNEVWKGDETNICIEYFKRV